MSSLDLGGTVRAVSVDETLARIRPLLPAFGITRVARITGLDHIGIPVSIAVRPASRLLSTSQGKGMTPELADISAMMESIETWHAEMMPAAGCRASCAELASRERVVPPSSLRTPPFIRKVQEDTEVIDWVSVVELSTEESYWLPRGFLNLDTVTEGQATQATVYRVTTTGLASGNTRAEAILHGLYEAIERDAHHAFVRLPPAEQAARRIAVDSVDCPHNRTLIARIQEAGVHLEVSDMTSVVGIPTFHAVIVEIGALSRYFVDEGMGTHLRPEIALSRAITEAAQSRLAYIAGSRDDLYPSTYRAERRKLLQNEGHAEARAGNKAFADVVRPPFQLCFDDNLRCVLKALKEAGHERVFCFDHTRPNLDVPVVHVLCPGLQDIAGE